MPLKKGAHKQHEEIQHSRHGEQYNKEGEEQLADYLDSHSQDTGYLLTFNFNKKKKQSHQTKQIKGKSIVEVVV